MFTGTFTRAVDPWSLGVNIFLLLTGKCVLAAAAAAAAAARGMSACVMGRAFTLHTPPLLAGTVPFGEVGQPDESIYDAIQTAPIHWGQAGSRLSAPAKDFISRLLEKDPAKRLTIDGALAHSWVAGDGAAAVPLDRALIQNLLAFNARNKFKRNAVHLVATTLPKEQARGGEARGMRRTLCGL